MLTNEKTDGGRDRTGEDERDSGGEDKCDAAGEAGHLDAGNEDRFDAGDDLPDEDDCESRWSSILCERIQRVFITETSNNKTNTLPVI